MLFYRQQRIIKLVEFAIVFTERELETGVDGIIGDRRRRKWRTEALRLADADGTRFFVRDTFINATCSSN